MKEKIITIYGSFPYKKVLRFSFQANVNIERDRERHDINAFLARLVEFENWIKEFTGLFIISWNTIGWTGKTYNAELIINYQNGNISLINFFLETFKKGFEVHFNQSWETEMALKRVPYQHWGTRALKSFIIEENLSTPEVVEKLEKPALLELINPHVASEEQETEVVMGDGEEVLVDKRSGEVIQETRLVQKEELEPPPKPEPQREKLPQPDEVVVLGEAAINNLLRKKGLWNELVDQMTIADKRRYIDAGEDEQNEMLDEMNKSLPKTMPPSKDVSPPPIQKPSRGRPRYVSLDDEDNLGIEELSELASSEIVDLEAKAKGELVAKVIKETNVEIVEEKFVKEKKPKAVGAKVNLNDELKKKGLWKDKHGLQFLKSEEKQALLSAKNEMDRDKIYQLSLKKLEVSKRAQSEKAKARAIAEKVK